MSWRLAASSLKLDRMLARSLRSGNITMMTTRGLRQMNLRNGPLVSDILQDFMNWCSSKPAKGFEKFYRDKPKGKQSEAPKRKEKAKEASGGGGGEPNIPKPKLKRPSQPPKSAQDLTELFRKGFAGSGGAGGGPGLGQQKAEVILGLGQQRLR